MGCGVSTMCKIEAPPSGENEGDAMWVCRQRKRVVKKAVKQRLSFGDAHSSYLLSLSSLSSAISSFVAPFSPPPPPIPPPFHLTLAPSSSSLSPSSSSSSSSSSSCSNSAPPPQVGDVFDEFDDESKWDFFNLLDSKPMPMPGESGDAIAEVDKGKVIEHRNRDLLEALKDVEVHFVRAYQSGFDVSRMLEVHHHPAFHHSFDNAKRKGSFSSRSSSSNSLLSSSSRCTSSTWADSRGDHKSLLSSCSENSSTWTHSRMDASDGYCGMVSGSHSFTLGRLYAWEKKLCNEVKTGVQTWKVYQQKCSQLQKKDLEGGDLCPSKAISEVKDLYYQILVTIQRAESISKQIEKLRDQELQPQLIELLHGLMRTWKTMLDTHEIQKKIVYEIRSFSRPDHGKFCSDSHRLATLQLEAVVQNWYTCFSNYVSAQKAYVKSLHGWLSKFVDAETKYCYKGSRSLPPIRFNGPTLMVICQSWLTSLERLPEKAVKNAMKSLTKDIQVLWVQQGEERQQKRKVDRLSEEMNKKILAVKRVEDKAVVLKYKAYNNMKDQVESLNEKKNQLDKYRKQIEVEKERYLSSLQQTQQVTLSRLQMGLSSVFDSLTDFSRASVNIYSDLLTFSQNAKV